MLEFREQLWQLPDYLTSPLQAQGYAAVMQGLKQKEIAKNALRNEKMVGKAVPTGLAIFWKHDKFIEFDDSKSGSGSGMTVFLQMQDESSSSSSLVCVNNIHLVGDPAKFDQHLKQLEGAKKQLDTKKITDSLKNGTVACVYEFICGDFNGDVLAVATASDEKDEDGGSCSSGRTTVGDWFHSNSYQRAPTGTSWSSDTSTSSLDHIMFRCQQEKEHEQEQGEDKKMVEEDTEQQELSSCLIRCARCLPGQSEELEHTLAGGLPNQFHPSDHVMLQADFDVSV